MTLTIDHSSPLPRHIQVEQLLRQLIELPQYAEGEYLPGELDLAAKLGISRNTIRQATNKLELEGLIIRKKGKGTRVAHKMVSTKLDSWHSFTQEMNDKGVSFINYLIKCELTEADQKVASFFSIPPKSVVFKLCRLRGDKNGPFVYFESYFHPCLGLNREDDFSGPLYELLEKKYNTPVVTSREMIFARKSNHKIANLLKIKKQDIVMIRERYVFDLGDRPVEYNIGYYDAEKFTYTIEIKR